MSNIIKKIEEKLGDHPNVSDDPNIKPTAGTEGRSAVEGDDPNKHWVQNKIDAGQGAGSAKDPSIKAGSTTSADTVSAATASGAIEGRTSTQ